MWRTMAAAGLAAERARLVPSRYVWQQYPEVASFTVPMGDVRFDPSNMDPNELYCLSLLCLLRRPRRIFEFGTFDGSTTLRLARLLPEVEIVTVDLLDDIAEINTRGAGLRSGCRFHGTSEQERITQVYGDSRELDVSPWAGSCDLVIVDAGHGYDYVSADTRSAVALVSERGVVVWDDYTPLWPDVVRAVDEASAAGDAKPIHLRGTELAVWDRALG